MAYVLESLNQDGCPDLAVCGYPKEENTDAKQWVDSEFDRKEWARAWRCKSCLQKEQDETLGKLPALHLPVIQTSPEWDGMHLSMARQLTQGVLRQQNSQLARQQAIEWEALSENEKAIKEMHTLPFETCPWSWQYDPLCLEVLTLSQTVNANPALFDPKTIKAPLWQALNLFRSSRKATENHWAKVRMEARKKPRS